MILPFYWLPELSITTNTRLPGCPSPAPRCWLHSVAGSAVDAAPAGGCCSRSVRPGPRPASLTGQQPQEEVDPVLVTIIQLRRRTTGLSLFINPCLRGVLRGWRPPGRGEGMKPARDAPCPRSGPAGGCTEAAARWCQAPRLGLRRGQLWALRQVPARSRGKQPGLCPCVFTPVSTVTNGAASPPGAARGRGQRPPSGLSHSRGPPAPGPTRPELPRPRRVKVGKERSGCGGLRREQEAPPGTLELVFGLGLLAACSKKRPWLTRRRLHAPLKNTN